MGTTRKRKAFKQNPGNSAICYYRYSSDAQRDCSIEQQKEAAWEYAEKNGLEIIEEYMDPGYSGTRSDRPDYQRMLYEVETLRPANLILWKTDRLARDREDLVYAKVRLRRCGVKIHYVAEAVPEDDVTQILVESIYEAMAETYSVNLRQNVLRGLTYNAERCLYNGNLVLGYIGEKNKPYRIDEKSAEIVKQIFEEYADGKPKQRIVDDLNRKGLRTVRGNLFTINSISHILSNNAYIGVYKYGDIIKEGGMPRIIEDELFEKVQERIKKNQRGGKGAIKKLNPNADIADYLLSGKLFCMECDSPMTGTSGKGKGGDLFYYYTCSGHRKKRCDMQSKKKHLLEKITRKVLQDLLSDGAYRIILAEEIYSHYQNQNDRRAYIDSLKARVAETDKKLKNIVKAIENGIFNDSTAERMTELESEKKSLQKEIAVEENKQKYRLTRNQIIRFLDSFAGDINNSEKFKHILELFVAKIYVTNNGKMLFTFYYSNDRKEVDIKEMEEYLDRVRKTNELMNIPSNDDFIVKKKRGEGDQNPFQ